MGTTFGMLIIAISVRVRLYNHLVRAFQYVYSCCMRRVKSTPATDNTPKPQLQIVSKVNGNIDSDADSVAKLSPTADDMV